MRQTFLFPKITMNAIISPCRKYRYTLERTWDAQKKAVLFIGLNPSTADANIDDPTIRRMVAFARHWGYGRLFVGNLFAFRSTDPKGLYAAEDPVGPDNTYYLMQLIQQSSLIIAAWGTHGAYLRRGDQVRLMIPELYHLGLTQNHQPKHPLYLPKTTTPIKWV